VKKIDLLAYLDSRAEELFAVAQDLYEHPEVSQEEARSSEVYKRVLKENGFTIH